MELPVTKVCETNVTLNQLKRTDVYKVLKKLHKGIPYNALDKADQHTLIEVFSETWNPNTFNTGVHFVLGWEIDFRPFMKQYEVTFLNQFYTKEKRMVYGFSEKQILECASTKINKHEKGILSYTAKRS